MKNIFSYIKAYGDRDFSEKPFCETDALILAQLSYLNFGGHVPADANAPVTAASLLSPPLIDEFCRNTLDEKNNRKFWKLFVTSRRFGSVKLAWHIDVVNVEAQKQFSAVTYILRGDLCVVAFRGTDLTVLGWKEDFNLAFGDEVPAQADAVDYLARVGETFGGRLIVCGHSKGGNLASYASAKNAAALGDRLLAVYNFDGPGFNNNFLSSPEYLAVAPKVEKFLPHGSMIGVLLRHTQQYSVVCCRGVGILQHDPYNWAIDDDGSLLLADALATGAEVFDAAIRDWVAGLDEAAMRIFIETVFFVLGADDGVLVSDYIRSPRKTFAGFRRRRKSLPDDRKTVFVDTMKALVRSVRAGNKRVRAEKRNRRRSADA